MSNDQLTWKLTIQQLTGTKGFGFLITPRILLHSMDDYPKKSPKRPQDMNPLRSVVDSQEEEIVILEKEGFEELRRA